MEPLAISPAKAAELLGISRQTIYTLLHRKDFPVFKVGSRTLISTEGLRVWVEAQAANNGGIEV